MNHLIKCIGLVWQDIVTEHRDTIDEYLTWGSVAVLVACCVVGNIMFLGHYTETWLVYMSKEVYHTLSLALMTAMLIIEVGAGWFTALLFKKCGEIQA